MKPILCWVKRRLIPICLLLCAFALAASALLLVASRSEIQVALVDVSGVTTGIRSLKISGEVEDPDTGLSYTFERGGDAGALGRVRFDPWDRSLTRSANYWPFVDTTEVTLEPIGDIREEIINNEPDEDAVYDDSRITRRVRADMYRVIPMIPNYYVPVRLDPGEEKLYYDGAKDTYLECWNFAEDDGYEMPNVNLGEYSRFASLPSFIKVEGAIYFIPAFDGLYGHTAVYAFDEPVNDELDLGGARDYPVREVLPIELQKGVDEVCGFLKHDNVMLLALRHEDEIELIRLLPDDGCFPPVTIPADLSIEDPLVSGDYMMFYAADSAGDSVDFRVLNTEEMKIVATGSGARIGIGGYYTSLFDIHAFCMAEDALYVGSEAMTARIENVEYRNRIYLTALDIKGARLGCAELLVGPEDDPNQPYDPSNNHFQNARSLVTLTLNEGGSHD